MSIFYFLRSFVVDKVNNKVEKYQSEAYSILPYQLAAKPDATTAKCTV